MSLKNSILLKESNCADGGWERLAKNLKKSKQSLGCKL